MASSAKSWWQARLRVSSVAIPQNGHGAARAIRRAITLVPRALSELCELLARRALSQTSGEVALTICNDGSRGRSPGVGQSRCSRSARRSRPPLARSSSAHLPPASCATPLAGSAAPHGGAAARSGSLPRRAAAGHRSSRASAARRTRPSGTAGPEARPEPVALHWAAPGRRVRPSWGGLQQSRGLPRDSGRQDSGCLLLGINSGSVSSKIRDLHRARIRSRPAKTLRLRAPRPLLPRPNHASRPMDLPRRSQTKAGAGRKWVSGFRSASAGWRSPLRHSQGDRQGPRGPGERGPEPPEDNLLGSLALAVSLMTALSLGAASDAHGRRPVPGRKGRWGGAHERNIDQDRWFQTFA